MDKVLLCSQMRAADAYTINKLGVPSRKLMFRAGVAIAEEVEKIAREKDLTNILIVCGNGNNGGDGFICGEVLRKNGYNIKIFTFFGNKSEDCQWAKSNYKGFYTEKIQADLIVDCIFGTGLTRNIADDYLKIIKEINKSGAYIISADIPSGLNGDNGLVMGETVHADSTVAIAEYKMGMFLCEGPDHCGTIIKKDIGIICNQENCYRIWSDREINKFYPKRKRNSHKGTYGSANVIAGSKRYTGAAVLATEAALKSGCGYVKLTTSEEVKFALTSKFPQVIFLEHADLSSQAIALGMGCGISEQLYLQIKYILREYGGVFIIDADGLNTIAKYGKSILKEKKCRVILTPHLKEFSRLTGLSVIEIMNDPIGLAEAFSKEYGVTLLLKSSTSIICGQGDKALNIRGTTALAKGGSGDMLAGYLCGCAARGLEPFDAAICAAYTLGLSAEISSEEKTDYCVTAKDVLKNLHFAVKRLTD